MIDTMSLLKIGDACIKFLLLNVLCPYECFSFIQRYRIVSLITTASAYLRAFALFAYIAEFTDNRSDIRFYMERKWNEKGDILISNSDKDIKN